MAKGSKATCPCCGQPVSREAEDAANEVIERRVDEAVAAQQAGLAEASQGWLSVTGDLWQRVRKFGAPPKRSAKTGERFAVGVRLTAELKSRLDQAAEVSGRSQSQEVEFRLERSFDRQSLMAEVLSVNFRSKHLAGLILLIGTAMEDAARIAHNALLRDLFDGPNAPADAPEPTAEQRDNWAWNPYAFDTAVNAAITILTAAYPNAPLRWKDEPPPEEGTLGFQLANQWIELVRGYDLAAPDDTWDYLLRSIKELLGDALEQIDEITHEQLRGRLQLALRQVPQSSAQRAAS